VNVRFLPVAAEELARAVADHELMQPGLGVRFERSFWNALDYIRRSPNAAPMIAADTRRHRLRRFPWGIVYTLRDEVVLIVAVMHLHRRPGYWSERITRN
jgi:toxin ParE2